MTPELFDRSRLSAREDAILEAAIEGMTDVQIAQRLAISQSTVNSYWVRIRGKLGQLSRTELVALALKAQARTAMDAVNAQLAALQHEAVSHTQLTADYANAEILRAALDAMPEAIFVCCDHGLIRFANSRLADLFGFDAGELIGAPVSILVPPGDRRREDQRIAEYVKDPRPMRLGINNVVYGQRKNGAAFRVVLLFDSRPVSNGLIVTCLVRDFTSEIETRRERASTWS